MPVDAWPLTLPQKFLRSSYAEGMGDGLLRSKMDIGPAKVRRRSSAAPRPLEVTARMTVTQVRTMRTFVSGTLLGGALPFSIPDPLGGGALLMVRLAEMPRWTAVSDVIYDVSLSLEVLP